MEQNWLMTKTGIEVEIDCIVHSAPRSQVCRHFKVYGGNFIYETVLNNEYP